jgi:hypothetical protein
MVPHPPSKEEDVRKLAFADETRDDPELLGTNQSPATAALRLSLPAPARSVTLEALAMRVSPFKTVAVVGRVALCALSEPAAPRETLE